MKAIKIAALQLTSFVVILVSAGGFLNGLLPTLLFVAGFAVFLPTAFYIARHQRELEKDVDELFGEESKIEG